MLSLFSFNAVEQHFWSLIVVVAQEGISFSFSFTCFTPKGRMLHIMHLIEKSCVLIFLSHHVWYSLVDNKTYQNPINLHITPNLHLLIAMLMTTLRIELNYFIDKNGMYIVMLILSSIFKFSFSLCQMYVLNLNHI